jgi:hypothetical protein
MEIRLLESSPLKGDPYVMAARVNDGMLLVPYACLVGTDEELRESAMYVLAHAWGPLDLIRFQYHCATECRSPGLHAVSEIADILGVRVRIVPEDQFPDDALHRLEPHLPN